MLASFCTKRTFYKLDVKLYVDCEGKKASLMIKYDGLIKRMDDDVPYSDVNSPEKADAWLGRPIPTRGGALALIEWLEAHYKAETVNAIA